MTVEITYNGELRTSATHIKSGNSLITDAPVDNQGKGEAFSPTDMVATALGSCILTIMGIKARDKGLNIEGTRAEVTKTMASAPRRIAKIEVNIFFPQNNFSDHEKMLLEKAAHGCPVGRSLHPDMEEVVNFHW